MSPRRRKIKRKPIRPVIWLIVEGETERYYLTGLRKHRNQPNPPSINIRCAGGRSPQHVVDKAEAFRQQQGDEDDGHTFICVFDAEDHTPRKRATLEQALDNAGQKGFGVAISNPCFEVWLRCHLDSFKPQLFNSCNDCINELCKAWSKQRISPKKYVKGDPNIYDKLAPHLQDAIKIARDLREIHHRTVRRTVDANASTDMYRLAEYLQGKKQNYHPYIGDNA